jgi:hypothetical protein
MRFPHQVVAVIGELPPQLQTSSTGKPQRPILATRQYLARGNAAGEVGQGEVIQA